MATLPAPFFRFNSNNIRLSGSAPIIKVMCGIVGYIGTRKAVPIILEGLKRLEYRGYDSAGLAVYCDDNDLAIRRASGKLRNLEDAIRLSPVDGSFGIGHTRRATPGRPLQENT